MRIAIAFLLFFSCSTTLAQLGEIDYLGIGDEFHEVYVTKDSVYGVEYRYVDYQPRISTFSYRNFRRYKKDRYTLDYPPIPVDSLAKIPDFKPDDVIYYNTGEDPRWSFPDKYYQIIDDSYWMSVLPNDSITENYAAWFNERVQRYEKWERPGFDLYLFHDGIGVDILYKLKNGQYKMIGSRSRRYDATYPYEGLASFDDHRKVAKGSPLVYSNEKGYEIFKTESGWGVYDLVKEENVLEGVYDSIKLNTYITVMQDGKFGAFDYKGNLLVPINNKKVDYYDNAITYITASNEFKAISRLGEPSQALDQVYEKFIPPNKDNDSLFYFWVNDDYHRARIAKDTVDGFRMNFYLKGYDGEPDTGPHYTKRIQNSELYNKMYFPGGYTFFGEIGMGNLLIGERPDQKFDILATYPNPKDSIMVRGVTRVEYRYEVIPNSKGYNWPYPIFEKDGMKSIWNFWEKTFNFRYKEILYRFMGYYRFELPDGRRGWTDWKNKYEYLDPD